MKVLRITIFFLLFPMLMNLTFAQAAEDSDSLKSFKKRYLMRSGVARDATEDGLGMIHVKGPKSFFKPEIDQVTWWGEFKPFKTWGRPKLQAKWFNASGEVLAEQEFKGEICRLAKTTLKMDGLDPKNAQGFWRVEVYYKGQLLDERRFSIFGAPKEKEIKKNEEADLPVIEAEKRFWDLDGIQIEPKAQQGA